MTVAERVRQWMNLIALKPQVAFHSRDFSLSVTPQSDNDGNPTPSLPPPLKIEPLNHRG